MHGRCSGLSPQAIVSSVTIYQSRLPFNVCLVSCLNLAPSVSLAAPSLEVFETVFFPLASWDTLPPLDHLSFLSIIRKNSHPCGIQVDKSAPLPPSLSFSLRFRDSSVYCDIWFAFPPSFPSSLTFFQSLIAFVTYSYFVYTCLCRFLALNPSYLFFTCKRETYMDNNGSRKIFLPWHKRTACSALRSRHLI